MNILSFIYWKGCHDTSAAVVRDGRLIAAAEEERFTRRKHDGSFPLNAINFCLKKAGIAMEDVDVIAFPSMPFRSGIHSNHAEMDRNMLRRLKAEGACRSRSVIHKYALDAFLRLGITFNWKMNPHVAQGFAILREHYSTIPPVRYFSHHLAHAAVAYLTSGYDAAAIATIDGRGDSYATVTWKATGQSITRMRAEPFTNSLGLFYLHCTKYLGLGSFAEGKTMGLSAYGDEKAYAQHVSSLLETKDSCWYQYRGRPSPEVLGFSQRNGLPIVAPPYTDFAAALQRALDIAVARISRSAIDEAQSRRLCLGGGVALNCAANGALLASGAASAIWIFPAAGDSGLSVGAALLCALQEGALHPGRIDSAYWGPEFTPSDYEAVLKRDPRVIYQPASNLAAEISQRLAAGEVIGWFQGRMELGPRALGNRSILADPRRVEMRDRVNRIKSREMWRPLAPVVLAEHASKFFHLNTPSPFMLFAVRVRAEKRSQLPAVVHIDGSARPQTVTREQNPRLHALLKAFEWRTGLPVLLNTSFNTASEPIVCTAEDAVKTFLATEIDTLVLGDFIVRRRN